MHPLFSYTLNLSLQFCTKLRNCLFFCGFFGRQKKKVDKKNKKCTKKQETQKENKIERQNLFWHLSMVTNFIHSIYAIVKCNCQTLTSINRAISNVNKFRDCRQPKSCYMTFKYEWLIQVCHWFVDALDFFKHRQELLHLKPLCEIFL